MKTSLKCILIMDRASSKILDKKNKSYVFIPGGLIRYLQPLDIGINRQFKDHLKNKYLTNLVSNIGDEPELEKETSGKEGKNGNIFRDSKKPSKLDEQRLNIINWVHEVLWSDDKIKKSAIINSFNKASIAYPLDGLRHVDFVFPEEVIN